MNKIILLSAFIVFLSSCQQKEESLSESLNPLIVNYYKELITDGSLTVDSINIYRIDTLTESLDTLRTFNLVARKMGSIQELIRKQQDVVQSLRGNNFAEQKKLEALGTAYARYLNRLKKTDSLLTSKTLDTVKPKGHIVFFNLKGHNASNAVSNIDSLDFVFDLDNRVLERKDLQ